MKTKWKGALVGGIIGLMLGFLSCWIPQFSLFGKHIHDYFNVDEFVFCFFDVGSPIIQGLIGTIIGVILGITIIKFIKSNEK